jgi:putative ABC transport system permease protein
MVMLDRKLLRDLFGWRGQVIAIAIIVACGVAMFVAMQSVYESLRYTQDSYYSAYRLSHIFASLTRAPEDVKLRLSAVDGVTSVQTRVVTDVTVDLPGRDDAVTMRLISVPEQRRPSLNDLYIREGRYISESASNEALVSEAFADANGLHVGDRIAAVINRRYQIFRVVGVALSPEYVYEIRGTSDIWPDNRHFGILWVGRRTLAGAFDLTDAFNDVAIATRARADESAVIARVDAVLERYGGTGAFTAREQASNRFLSDELSQLRTQAVFIPLIFLGIAAFLLNVALSRLVATQREQIAILKALGVDNTTIAFHYAKAVAAIVAIGAIIGTAFGAWLGWRLTVIYTRFFHFPLLSYQLSVRVLLVALGISAVAALIGALAAVLRATGLPPAEAMRPPAPLSYGASLVERVGLTRFLRPGTRMIARNIERKPFSSLGTIVAIALAAAMLVLGRYGYDAIAYMMDLQFQRIEREDVTLTFVRPLSNRSRYELASLPGVQDVEPFRAVAVRLEYDHHERRVALLGLPQKRTLFHIVDASLREHEVPDSGILMSKKLADLLHLRAGDNVEVNVLEGRRSVRSIRVAGTVDDIIGLNAYMRDDDLHRMLDEDRTLSGAHLRIDAAALRDFDRRIKAMPAVAGVSYRASMLEQFEKTVAESMGISIAFLIGFAAAIACGVVYNAGRIAISERAREFSTLRILGFTRVEVAELLLSEQAVLTVVAIPLGCALGYAVCLAIAPLYETEVYRMPVIVSGVTYAFATIVVLVTAICSAFLLRYQVDRLDIISVLKATD